MPNLFTNYSRPTTLRASFENAGARTRQPTRSNFWRKPNLFRELRPTVSGIHVKNGNTNANEDADNYRTKRKWIINGLISKGRKFCRHEVITSERNQRISDSEPTS